MGNASPMIVAAIGAVIAIVVSFVTYPILQSAADTYYLEFTPHCEQGGESFVRVYVGRDRLGVYHRHRSAGGGG